MISNYDAKLFIKIMTKKVKEILLISSAYDAFIMEEDGRLTERIISEYKGLNLSNPPVITWKETAKEALEELRKKEFDIIITMPRINDMSPFELNKKIKKEFVHIPIYMLTHDDGQSFITSKRRSNIEQTFVWRGNTDLLLALIKNTEDKMNVDNDCKTADVKTIIFVEDSPFYRSNILPMLYKEIVLQTQAIIEDALNSEEKLLRMRTRPKILIAETFEEAENLYEKYKDTLMAIITDVRYPKENKENKEAGFLLASKIKEKTPALDILILSSEDENKEKAEEISATFINKNSDSLYADIRYFFMNNLCFGDFLFREENKKIIARASNILTMYNILHTIPAHIIYKHIQNNDFSKWFYARHEIQMAKEVNKLKNTCHTQDVKQKLSQIIKSKFEERQKESTIIDFKGENFNIDIGYSKVGQGSLGGKARGLAFMLKLLKDNQDIETKFDNIKIKIPKSMVITTEGFIKFLDKNNLNEIDFDTKSDEEIKNIFLNGKLPNFLYVPIKNFLKNVQYPIAIRSSSFMEDAHLRPCAGLYKTYMLPNISPDYQERRDMLQNAIKLVYASIFLQTPRNFFKNTNYNKEEDKMAVLIQELCGNYHENYFYPLIAGIAQSYNFYPNEYMKKEEGIIHIAMGFGKSIVEGERTIRFSPLHPKKPASFSTIDDILKNAQRFFYALDMKKIVNKENFEANLSLNKLEIEDAKEHGTLEQIASSYFPETHKIKDFYDKNTWPIITFAKFLKYGNSNLSQLLSEILKIGEEGMGTPVEIEFAIDIKEEKLTFYILQIRPMAVNNRHHPNILISEIEKKSAFCFSTMAMGMSGEKEITDIIYVDNKTFDIAKTVEIAKEIGKINAILKKENKKYLLIGPGRWGSADRWLGIPVTWSDISQVDTIIENKIETLNVEPSQGSHFFHNITALNISYISIWGSKSFIKSEQIENMKVANKEKFVKHINLEKPLILKIDAENSQAVIRESL